MKGHTRHRKTLRAQYLENSADEAVRSAILAIAKLLVVFGHVCW